MRLEYCDDQIGAGQIELRCYASAVVYGRDLVVRYDALDVRRDS